MASTLRALRPIDGRNNRPSRSTIERLVKKFESTGTVQNVPVPVRQRSVSHTLFSTVGHLCDVVVPNLRNDPGTSLQNQIDARTKVV